MGNKLCCFCRREEDHPGEEIRIHHEEEIQTHHEEDIRTPHEEDISTPHEEEIPMSTFNEFENPEEPSRDASDSSDYVEMRPRTPSYISLLDVTDKAKEETFRLRVMAEHQYCSNLEYRVFYDATVPMNSALQSEYTECLFHVSVYDSRNERIMDLTYINDLKQNCMSQCIIYWKNSQEDSWTLNYSSEHSPRPLDKCQLSSLKNVFLWATATHTKNRSEDHKELFLSAEPDTSAVPSHFKKSIESMIHITAYNARLMKIFDMVLIQGRNAECHVQSRDARTERTRQFSMDEAGSYSNTFS